MARSKWSQQAVDPFGGPNVDSESKTEHEIPPLKRRNASLEQARDRYKQARKSTDSIMSNNYALEHTTNHELHILSSEFTPPSLDFGSVPCTTRKTLVLTVLNDSDSRSARLKFLKCRTDGPSRFTCDLHLCVVSPGHSVKLRLSYTPEEADEEKTSSGKMIFLVNDEQQVHCVVRGEASRRNKRLDATKKAMRETFTSLSSFTPSVQADSYRTTETTTDREDDEEDESAKDSDVQWVPLPPIDENTPTPSKRRRKRETSCALDFTTDFVNNKRRRTRLSNASEDGRRVSSGSWWSHRRQSQDESWMQRQEKGLTSWINYVLLDPQLQQVAEEKQTSSRFDFSSLRVLTQKRVEASYWQHAREVYTTDDFKQTFARVGDEIEKKKLTCRTDRPVYADLGLQQELLSLLNNYHPAWLALAIGTIIGHQGMQSERVHLRSMLVAPKRKGSPMPKCMRRLILHRLVHDPVVAQDFRLVKNLRAPLDGSLTSDSVFRHKKTKVTGREYFDALSEHFVLKVLMVVKLLDACVLQRHALFQHFPCLFKVSCTTQDVLSDHELRLKRSEAILNEFSRLFLAQEGRIEKHLRQLDYVVSYEQLPLDEIDAHVKHLSTDLRDGIRLARLLETLTNVHLSNQLRVPALSRLQKVHNMEVSLSFLKEECGETFLSSLAASSRSLNAGKSALAKDLVDGHREKTLALLWHILSRFQLPAVVDTSSLEREIQWIKRRLSLSSVEFLMNEETKHPLRHLFQSQDVDQVLLEWCRVVCANYFTSVRDYTSSFQDGRVLCLVLHYYHPMLLSKQDLASGNLLHVLNDRVHQLGDIPVMLPTEDLVDASLIKTFVSYLQSRLLSSTKELHAARTLKRWWRHPRLQLYLKQKKQTAAKTIQRFWSASSARRFMIRQCRRLLRHAHIVKASIQMYYAKKKLHVVKKGMKTLQRRWRMLETKVNDKRRAVLVIQSKWRQRKERMEAMWILNRLRSKRQETLRINAVVRLQRWWHKRCFRMQIQHLGTQTREREKQRKAVSILRSFMIQVKSKRRRRRHGAATKLQRMVRRWRDRRRLQEEALGRYQEMLQQRQAESRRREGAVSTVQRAYRHARTLKLQTDKTCVLQAWYRNVQRRRRLLRAAADYKRRDQSAILLQRTYRTYMSRQGLLKTAIKLRAANQHQSLVSRSVTKLQRFYRRHLLSRALVSTADKYKRESRAVYKIQRCWRLSLHRHQLVQAATLYRQERLRSLQLQWERQISAVVLQRHFRLRRVRLKATKAVIKLQAYARQKIQTKRFRYMQMCAIKIQKIVRGYDSRKKMDFYDIKRKLAQLRVVSSCWRIEWWYIDCQKRTRWKEAAVVLQLWWRRCRAMEIVKVKRREKDEERMQDTPDRQQSPTMPSPTQPSTASEDNHLETRYMPPREEKSYSTPVQDRPPKETSSLTQSDSRMEKSRPSQKSMWKQHSPVTFVHAQPSSSVESSPASPQVPSSTIQKSGTEESGMHLSSVEERGKSLEPVSHAIETGDQVEEASADTSISSSQEDTSPVVAVSHDQSTQYSSPRDSYVDHATMTEESLHCDNTDAHDVHTHPSHNSPDSRNIMQETMEDNASSRHTPVHPQETQSQENVPPPAPVETQTPHQQEAMAQSTRKETSSPTPQQTTPSRPDQSPKPHKSTPVGGLTSAVERMQVEASTPPSSSIVRTPDSRLSQAIHVLFQSRSLSSLLEATHTIEICTRFSHDDCTTCLEAGVASTLFAAIGGLGRSSDHERLLRQVLLILINLNTFIIQSGQDHLFLDDARGMEALVDILHSHRDTKQVFVLAARVLKVYLGRTKDRKRWEMWRRRLEGLQRLLDKRAQVLETLSSTTRAQLTARMNPRTGVSVLTQLLHVMHACTEG